MDDIQKLAERIRAEIPIASIIAESETLQTRGKRLVGHCPFHHDTEPSLIVSPSKNSWRCWPCNADGDSIVFWMRKSQVTFEEAVNQLATRLD
jgi:DNA primase